MAYAGLDVGTSSCKIVVYDAQGNTLLKAGRQYRERGEDGYREIDPAEVMANVEAVLKEVGAVMGQEIEGLAIASLGESIICVDAEKAFLGNSMVTGDKRGIDETAELEEKITKELILEITGLPPSEMYGLPKYMWLNKHTASIKEAQYIFFFEDYVGYTLTAKRMVSYSSASRSMAFDIQSKCWAKELLAHAGIKAEQMSEPVPSGTVIGELLPKRAKELGLNPKLKVVVGGHDQSCAALGSGLKDASIGECGMGTCEFMFLMLPKIETTPYMIENDLPCVPYVFPETYLTSLEITTCGVLKNWAKDTVLQGRRMECDAQGLDFYNNYIDAEIADMRTDVMLLPQFGSSGNPDINYNVKGTVTGLTVHTKPEEIYRAILEGLAFQMYLSYEKAQELGVEIERQIVTGGGAASDLTLQIRADVFDMEVATIHSDESGTLGCMMLAATALGEFADLQEAIRRGVRIKKRFYPDQQMHAYYMRKYEKYKKLYELMHLF
ncbi:MAG: FGGY-family carbohydrate kinase [Lachnospiraceae bacterium]